MTSSEACSLAAGVLAYAAASSAFVGYVLRPLVRSAGARRTWLRCLIRSYR